MKTDNVRVRFPGCSVLWAASPARFMPVAGMNPCSCGSLNDPRRTCVMARPCGTPVNDELHRIGRRMHPIASIGACEPLRRFRVAGDFPPFRVVDERTAQLHR